MKNMINKVIKKGVDRTLKRAGYRATRTFKTPKKNLIAHSVPGWFYPEECFKLYETILLSQGDILEIGHFLGKSTACICEALKTFGRKRTFNSYDLGISEQEYKKHYEVVQKYIEPPFSLYQELFCSEDKTITDIAREQLTQHSLDSYVNLIYGDFKMDDSHSYDVIFCDSIHNPHEIQLNLPAIISRSNPGATWIFHDMNEENIKIILDVAPCEYLSNENRLGLFYYHGK